MTDKKQNKIPEQTKESEDTWFISEDAVEELKYIPRKKLEAAMALAQTIHSDNNKQ